MFLLAIILTAALIPTRVGAEAPEAANPEPYTAVYSVSYRGLHAGLLHFELKSGEPGMYVYESHAEPSLLARLVVSSQAVERSVMQIDGNGVQPLYWFMEDGKSGHEDDGVLEFTWDKELVTGEVEGTRVELPTEPGLQDRLSIQIEVMTALLRTEEPGTIPMIDEDKIKRYSYTRAGTERIATKMGEFETVIYESTRPGSSRLSRIWHAPALGYIPARAVQLRKGNVETEMELVKVKRKGD
ncbi:DUF3108 domain-containing protein [Desulfuromonas sp. TF]|uniref:DUF3108 domain-containing protein n=1 Tax=Desulfuromonas sp. TF TaxID=1232410 RepID=UPI000412EC46|nr:DUF3108 domain-containing protein [Desulfuromonas sp. TF]